MNTLRIYPTSINSRFIDEAAQTLASGKIIIYPTDSYYALGCSALSNRAIERLCGFKGINPQKQTLSVVCCDISQASEYALIDNRAYSVLRANTPGPFTFVLPSAPTLPKVFKGRRNVGIRVPDNAIARALADELGHPLLSASITGVCHDGAGTIEASAIEEAFENLDIASLMIDGGEGYCEGSTVVDLTDSASPQILRQGRGELV